MGNVFNVLFQQVHCKWHIRKEIDTGVGIIYE